MGFIGCGRQTYHKNIPLFVRTPGVQALAVCDVDTWRLDSAVQQIKTQYDSGKATGTFSAAITSMKSSISGFPAMTFAPKGFSVRRFTSRTCS